ncbi:hypothetical protein [Glycomyces tarimensis]
MGGLTDEERERLRNVIALRVGARSDAGALTTAYLDAMARSAYARTVEPGPVPTSLTSERSEILVQISRQLGRVIEDFEIQALFRVTPTQARSMRRMLQATHSDEVNELDLAWSEVGAVRGKHRKSGRTVTGEVVIFAAEDRRDAFVAYAERTGYPVEVVRGEPDAPWQVIVGDAFPIEQLPERP